jgi:hypothetical protein
MRKVNQYVMIVKACGSTLRTGAGTSSSTATISMHPVRTVVVLEEVVQPVGAAVAVEAIQAAKDLPLAKTTVGVVEVVVATATMAPNVEVMPDLSMAEFTSIQVFHRVITRGMHDNLPNSMLMSQGLCWDL